jgi:hypothetical protein
MRRRIRIGQWLIASVVLGCSPAPSPSPPVTAPPVPADVVAWPDISWFPVEMADEAGPGDGEQIAAVTSGAEGFVAVGYRDAGGVSDGLIWHSTDGETWEEAGPADELGHVELVDVAPAPDGYVAMGVGSLGAANERPHVVFFRSMDGRSWMRLGDLPGSADTYPGSVTGGAGGVLAAGSDADGGTALWRSIDGRTFERVNVDVTQGTDVTDPRAIAGGYLALGSSIEAPKLLRSADGIAWRATPIDASDEVLAVRVVPGDWGIVVQGLWAGECSPNAACASQAVAWWSGDGSAWARLPVDGSPVASGASVIVPAGRHGLVAVDGASAWASPDGWAWRPLPEPGDGSMAVSDAVVDGDSIVAVGTVAGEDGISHGAIVVGRPD